MSYEDLGTLLLKANRQKAGAVKGRDFTKLNDTILKILMYHLPKITLTFVPCLTPGKEGTYLLCIKYGDFRFTIPMDVLEVVASENIIREIRKKMDENILAEARGMFDRFGLNPEGEWVDERDENERLTETWEYEPHPPEVWDVYEANKVEWLVQLAHEVSNLDSEARKEKWNALWGAFGIEIRNSWYGQDGWNHQRSYSYQVIPLKGELPIKYEGSRQTTSAGSSVSTHSITPVTGTEIVLCLDHEGGDIDVWKVTIIDPEALASVG